MAACEETLNTSVGTEVPLLEALVSKPPPGSIKRKRAETESGGDGWVSLMLFRDAKQKLFIEGRCFDAESYSCVRVQLCTR